MKIPLPSFTLSLVLALGTVLSATWMAPTHAASPKAIGQTAPSLQWTRLEGGSATLEQWRGRPVLINYWASWCGPCLKELPDLQRFSHSQSGVDRGVQVIGIALDEADAAATLRDRLALTYPQLVEPDGPPGTASAFGNTAGTLPFSVLIDANGRVLQVHNGLLHPEDLARWAAAAR